ncbi:sulfatase-like hydrolase/transferase [Myxococcota bacterium]|nr:sulfatase-like hydrolase/transferase [Myxococcota bacterium]
MKPDIVWFLLDGVRPDRVKICGGKTPQTTFIDEVLSRGTLFTRSIAAGPYSLIALNALFTSLYGTTNGVNAAYKTTSDDLHSDAVTITDLLRREGYTTMCYAGSPFEPVEPLPSFDVYRLMPILSDRVFDDWEAVSGPRFASLSFQHVHDACCNAPQEMTAERFEQAIAELAREFERYYRRLVGPNTLAMVFSDHGMRLRDRADPDWDWESHPEMEPTTGVYLTDNTIRTFTGLIHEPTFPVRVVEEPVRSIDMAPTILDAFQLPPLGGQGESLWPELRDGGPMPERVAYSETGGRWFSPWRPNVRAVRTHQYKFTRHDSLGEALHDLVEDPREEENLIGKGLAQESELRDQLDRLIREAERVPEDVYEERGIDHGQVRLDRPASVSVPELSKAMNAYEGIRNALAYEVFDEVHGHAESLVLLTEREADRTSDEEERGAFLILRELAEQYSGVTDLEEARELFGRISQLLIAFVAAHPSFHDSLVAYHCGDAPGYGKWVQKRNDDSLVNPYLGRDAHATVRETDFVP